MSKLTSAHKELKELKVVKTRSMSRANDGTLESTDNEESTDDEATVHAKTIMSLGSLGSSESPITETSHIEESSTTVPTTIISKKKKSKLVKLVKSVKSTINKDIHKADAKVHKADTKAVGSVDAKNKSHATVEMDIVNLATAKKIKKVKRKKVININTATDVLPQTLSNDILPSSSSSSSSSSNNTLSSSSLGAHIVTPFELSTPLVDDVTCQIIGDTKEDSLSKITHDGNDETKEKVIQKQQKKSKTKTKTKRKEGATTALSSDTASCTPKKRKTIIIDDNEYINDDDKSNRTFKIIPIDDSRMISDLICILCKRVLYWEPVETPCHHIFCKSCLPSPITKCPSCSYVIMTPHQVRPINEVNKVVQRMIENIPVKCSNYPECHWTGLLNTLVAHFDLDCQAEKIQCTHCEESIKRGEIIYHVRTDCSSRPTSCEYCGTLIPYVNMSMHDTQCERKPVQCSTIHIEPYHKVDGCGAEMERRYLLEHQQKLCSKTLMTCEYGCFISPSVLSSSLTSPYEQVILSREAMMKHNEECLTRHCHTMMKRLLQLERSIKQRITQEVKSKVDVLHQTMVELFESKLAELSITPSSIPSSLSSTMSTSNSTISGDTNNIIHNERHVQQPMLMMPTVILLGGENDKVRARNCVYGLYGKDWEYIIDLPHSLGCTTACRLDDRIYVMGGKLRTKEGLNDIVYMLHIPTWKWSVKAKMKQTRWGMTSVLCGGRIYVMGGMNKSTLKSVEIYHSVQDTWSPGPHMLRKRHLFASVSIGTQIFVFGGDSNDSKDSKDSKEPSAEVLDTTTNKWSFIAKPLSNRDRHIAISPNSDTIWILGGVISKGTDSYLRKVEEYRISTNTWSILSWCLPKALSLASAYYDATNEQVIIIGGYEEGYGKDNQQLAQSSTWSINKASGECINLSSLPEPLFASGFVSLL